ncbi:hypothetical protein HK102_008840, partial [Quaeritorhiza haematococci]
MIRTRVHDIGLAYNIFTAMSPRGFTPQELRRVMKSVTKLTLTENQVDLLYQLFDRNGDGRLDDDEFYKVLK